ncbi:MAG: PAS domain S-box protein, partial [Oscillospiraceae bacterium]|nr:PAS domain S-box protein [Oscillospiraceae bacterium]
MSERFPQHKLHDLAQYLPEGYTYQKLIMNDKGQVEDCVFLDANPAFGTLAGIKSESIIGKRATEVFTQLKTSKFDWISFLENAVLSGKTQDITRYVDIFDRWCRIIAYSPENMHCAVIFQDKTAELQPTGEPEHLKSLQAMFDAHTAVMLLIEPSAGQIVDANLAAGTFYGYTREELKNMCIEEISPSFKEEIKRRHLEARNQEHRYFLFPHRRKNGEIQMVDVYSSPIQYGDKTLCYMIIFDVTSREKYKEDLSHKKELLSITLSSIGDGVVTTDKDGKITSLNKA